MVVWRPVTHMIWWFLVKSIHFSLTSGQIMCIQILLQRSKPYQPLSHRESNLIRVTQQYLSFHSNDVNPAIITLCSQRCDTPTAGDAFGLSTVPFWAIGRVEEEPMGAVLDRGVILGDRWWHSSEGNREKKESERQFSGKNNKHCRNAGMMKRYLLFRTKNLQLTHAQKQKCLGDG